MTLTIISKGGFFMKRTRELVIYLGVRDVYFGYDFLITALDFLMEDESLRHFPGKILFPRIAAKYYVNTICVERDLRTIITKCWNSPYRERLVSIATMPLDKKPTVTEFINILYWHLRLTDPVS